MNTHAIVARLAAVALALLPAVPSAAQSCPAEVPGTYLAVAMGDSIIWGQGLREEDKFKNIVAEEYRRRRGLSTLRMIDKSHSGAIVDTQYDSTIPDGEPEIAGELSSAYPTVEQQLDLVTSELDADGTPRTDVDLVLVQGCMNDIQIGYVVFAVDELLAPPDELIAEIDEQCRVDMGEALVRTANAFPNAEIVVTGYFPIITADTNVTAFGATAAVVLAAFGLPEWGIATWAALEAVKLVSIARSEIFEREGDRALRAAVDETNAAIGGPPRVRFHSPNFAADNAFMASDTLLFGLPPNDPMHDVRAQLCADDGRVFDAYLMCAEAGLGHPTAEGNTRWVHSIIVGDRGNGAANFARPGLGLFGVSQLENVIDRVDPGDVVELTPGYYSPHPARIDKHVVLESFGGCAIIGRPE